MDVVSRTWPAEEVSHIHDGLSQRAWCAGAIQWPRSDRRWSSRPLAAEARSPTRACCLPAGPCHDQLKLRPPRSKGPAASRASPGGRVRSPSALPRQLQREGSPLLVAAPDRHIRLRLDFAYEACIDELGGNLRDGAALQLSGSARQRSSRCAAALIIMTCASVSLMVMVSSSRPREPDNPAAH